jgi:3-oxoacyl-[acyl-carrier-protein] synthase-3
MKTFVVNSHGRIILPFNFIPELDFSVFRTLEQFEAVIRRDFEEKAPADADIVAELDAGGYTGRYQLLRELARNLFWTNRYALAMYSKRPLRWRDVPRRRDDVFLPTVEPWDADELAGLVQAGYGALPATWDSHAEGVIFGILLDVLRGRRGQRDEIQAINPTVAEALADPGRLVYHIVDYTPDYPCYTDADIIGYTHAVPELEALMRQAMVLHDEFPWDRERTRLTPIGALDGDDVVLTLSPRTRDVLRFLTRVRRGEARPPRRSPAGESRRSLASEPRLPARPVGPVDVRTSVAVKPRLEALTACVGEHVFSNEDLIRNVPHSWSPITVEEIRRKTGIDQRRYTELELEEFALQAAAAALEKSGRRPDDLSAVIVCTCTSARSCPSVAAWVSARLGLLQTHASFDLVAACAGLPYGLAQATHLLQEGAGPVLIVCAEKFSDKIGTVRTSRMLFGDAAAALVIGPASDGAPPDIEVYQTYASGPVREVDSIVWPNPEFDNGFTVYGPDVRSMAARYLKQMAAELGALPRLDGGAGSLADAVDLIVPHQANRTMVTELAEAAGFPRERLYFNIERVGNTSAASIPLAIRDAVREGVIDRPLRVFAPGFGAGAAAGYAVLRVDPVVVA